MLLMHHHGTSSSSSSFPHDVHTECPLAFTSKPMSDGLKMQGLPYHANRTASVIFPLCLHLHIFSDLLFYVKVSISSTFYARVFRTKVSLVTVQLCNFWRQNISAKWACKMLMKLTQSVNFTIIY